MNRRHFLAAGVTSIAASAMPRFAMARTPGVQMAVFDERFAAGLAFGRSMAARGVISVGFDGDVTNVWLDRLDPLWRNSIESVVHGLTTHPVLFCIERLAWDRDLRVVQRIEWGAALRGGRTEPLAMWTVAPRRTIG